jgi:short-subunit dehydrogenase
MPLNDYRTAFVTGASSGIGAALCKLLAEHGIEVALAARREDALRVLAEEIERDGGRARVVPLDVGEPEAVAEVMRETDDAMGGIDLVVANAGTSKTRWSGKLQWSDCAPTLRVNVIGTTATLTALIGRMVERERGHLVGISSLAAYRGLPKNAVYSASKAYVSTLLESLRVDLRSKGVHVTDVRPGYVHTPLTEGNKNMPFVMEATTAARHIVDAIAAKKSVHAFPFPLAIGVRSVAALPASLYDHLARRMM